MKDKLNNDTERQTFKLTMLQKIQNQNLNLNCKRKLLHTHGLVAVKCAKP